MEKNKINIDGRGRIRKTGTINAISGTEPVSRVDVIETNRPCL